MPERTKRTVVAVFLPREHLPFIRHWCEHHIQQGWTVFLYDNTGATVSLRKTSKYHGGTLQSAGKDGRGLPYGRYTAALSNAEVRQQLIAELAGLPVMLKTWQPLTPDGRIAYGQVEAYVDFLRRHSSDVEWAAFIDLDEYLQCGPGLNWDTLFHSMREADCHRVLLEAHRYESRWTPAGEPRAIESLQCCGLQHADGRPAGMKNVVRPEKVLRADVHWNWRTEGGNYVAKVDSNQFFFRHYNAATGALQLRLSNNSGTAYDESIAV